MKIKFEKQYPDFSRVPYCINLCQSTGRIYIALWLDSLPKNSQVVYASPSRGKGLVQLAPLLSLHRVKLIENYSMTKPGETIRQMQFLLHKSITKAQLDNVELVEEDFVEVWSSLSNVDFLLLDGPPTITNFEPFSNKFVYMMHDINQRLRTGALDSYLAYLCRADDLEQFTGIPDKMLHPALKTYRDIDRDRRIWKEFGPHGWLVGRKA